MTPTPTLVRSIAQALPGGSAALIVALLLGVGTAAAQERADPAGQVQLALERGGIPGFAALTGIADRLEGLIQADTRVRVEGVGPFASLADVTLRLRLGPELLDATPAIRLESVGLEIGHTVQLKPEALRALERGEAVTVYAGALPAAIGVVRVNAEGAAGGASHRLDRAFRLAMAPGQRAAVRIELVEDTKGGWDLSPVLERAPTRPNGDEPEEPSP